MSLEQVKPEEAIELRKVSTHNLKNIDISIPYGQWTVVTGVSGSGKSSLVFDTLYAESYSRYIESLSSFARQFLKVLPRPTIGEVRGLPPSVAVSQHRAGYSNRSTVGTLTEVSDLLRLVFSYAGTVYCPNGHGPIEPLHIETVFKDLQHAHSGESALILAPLKAWSGMSTSQLLKELAIQGFTRVLIGQKLVKLDEVQKKSLASDFLVVDRVKVSASQKERILGSLELALTAGQGYAAYRVNDALTRFNKRMACNHCGEAMVAPTPLLFNPNHPFGACGECHGFGRVAVLDPSKIVPKPDDSLKSQGVACWNFGKHTRYYQAAIKSAKAVGIDPGLSFKDYDKNAWDWLFKGQKGTGFTGVNGYFQYLDRKKYKAHYRIHASRFKTYELCPSCSGHRLNSKANHVKINGTTFGEAEALRLAALSQLVHGFANVQGVEESESKGEYGSFTLGEALEELRDRLDYLLEMGLGYLTLNRRSPTLSGGELQRIKMARSLGNVLTGTMFCLDEPSVGLHPRDTGRLIRVIRKIQSQGNTIVMVEHEESLIRAADQVIELGPEAGAKGGRVTYVGAPRPETPKIMSKAASNFSEFLDLKGVATNNLKSIDVQFPIGAITCVCGVSGSGKTSLVRHSLFPFLSKALGEPVDSGLKPVVSAVGPQSVLDGFQKVVLLGQEAIGRSSRSNIATYLGFFSHIRKIFAELPRSAGAGYGPGHFSFNVPGGRCEHCKGMGVVIEDLSFLGEMEITCSECDGRRFKDDVLEIKYRDYSLLDVLGLTIHEARELFFDQAKLTKALDAVIEIGLGYLTLGQSTSTYSGGEAQRLKLLGLMNQAKKGQSFCLIIDEPTSGLSDKDIQVLLKQLKLLTSRGHTLVMVEHHLDVMRACDWLIEIGPEGGPQGGELVFMGCPADLNKFRHCSPTAPYLFPE